MTGKGLDIAVADSSNNIGLRKLINEKMAESVAVMSEMRTVASTETGAAPPDSAPTGEERGAEYHKKIADVASVLSTMMDTLTIDAAKNKAISLALNKKPNMIIEEHEDIGKSNEIPTHHWLPGVNPVPALEVQVNQINVAIGLASPLEAPNHLVPSPTTLVDKAEFTNSDGTVTTILRRYVDLGMTSGVVPISTAVPESTSAAILQASSAHTTETSEVTTVEPDGDKGQVTE